MVPKGMKLEPVNNRIAWCAHCRQMFDAYRRTARYCSVRCRVAAHRKSLGKLEGPAAPLHLDKDA